MADFFSGLAQGVQSGVDMSLQQRRQKALEDQQAFSQQLQSKQMELQQRNQDIEVTGTMFKVLDSNIPPSARGFLMDGLASKLGVDPKSEYYKGFKKALGGIEGDGLTAIKDGLTGLLPDANPGEIASMTQAIFNGKIPFDKAIELWQQGAKRKAARQAFDMGGNGTGGPAAAPGDSTGASTTSSDTGTGAPGASPVTMGPTAAAAAWIKDNPGKTMQDYVNLHRAGPGSSPVAAAPGATGPQPGHSYLPDPAVSSVEWQRRAALMAPDNPEGARLAMSMADQAQKMESNKASEPVVIVQDKDGKNRYVPQSQASREGLTPGNASPEILHSVYEKNPDGTDNLKKPILLPTSQAKGMTPYSQPIVADPFAQSAIATTEKRAEPFYQREIAAQDTKKTTAVIQGALDSGTFVTGTAAGLRLNVARTAEALGLNPEKYGLGKPSTGEALEAAFNNLSVEGADSLSKSTNLSLNLLKESMGNLLKTPEGNQLIIDLKNTAADTDIAVAKKLDDYKARFPGQDWAFPKALDASGKPIPPVWEEVRRIQEDALDPAKWEKRIRDTAARGAVIDIKKLPLGSAAGGPQLTVGSGKSAKQYSVEGTSPEGFDQVKAPRPIDGKEVLAPVIWHSDDAAKFKPGTVYMFGPTGQLVTRGVAPIPAGGK